mgnify:FL=1
MHAHMPAVQLIAQHGGGDSRNSRDAALHPWKRI